MRYFRTTMGFQSHHRSDRCLRSDSCWIPKLRGYRDLRCSMVCWGRRKFARRQCHFPRVLARQPPVSSDGSIDRLGIGTSVRDPSSMATSWELDVPANRHKLHKEQKHGLAILPSSHGRRSHDHVFPALRLLHHLRIPQISNGQGEGRRSCQDCA